MYKFLPSDNQVQYCLTGHGVHTIITVVISYNCEKHCFQNTEYEIIKEIVSIEQIPTRSDASRILSNCTRKIHALTFGKGGYAYSVDVYEYWR